MYIYYVYLLMFMVQYKVNVIYDIAHNNFVIKQIHKHTKVKILQNPTNL